MAAHTSLPAHPQSIPQAQTIPAPITYDSQPLPKDPAAALLLASQANGLGGDGLKPWYLKAHYQTYDAQGKPASKGIFELYWAANDHYRVSYTDDVFTQSIYRTPDGDYRLGTSSDIPYAQSLIWGEIMHPLEVWDEAPPPRIHDRKSSQVPLTCLEIQIPRSPVVSSYCLDTQRALLRAMSSDGYDAVYNKPVVFQHRFIAESITLHDGEQHVLDLAIDELRGIKETELQTLVPPSSATKTERLRYTNDKVDARGLDPSDLLNGNAMADHVIFKGQPTYPAEAKQRRAQGTVRIVVTIGKEGFVRDPVVVHDPDAALSKAAVETISKWRYAPYLLDGRPVEVRTIVRIKFVLGG